MLIAVAAMAFASCTKVSETPVATPENGAIRVRFAANAALTKVGLTPEDNDTRFSATWDEDDHILITSFVHNGPLKETVDAEWSTTDASFTTLFEAENYATGAYDFVGVWPVEKASNELFPAERHQSGAAYNGDYDIMKSNRASSATLKADDTIVLDMVRQTSIAYFHITSKLNENIVSATLTTDKPIASSNATLDYDGFEPNVETAGVNSIKLIVDGEMSASDFKLWFNVLPVEYETMSLVVETTNHTFSMSKRSSGKWNAGELNKVVLTDIPAEKWAEKAIDAEPVEVTVSISDYASTHSWTNTQQYTNLSVDGNVVVNLTYTNSSQQNNTGKYYSNNSSWRIYQAESGTATFSFNSEEYVFIDAKVTYTAANTGVMTYDGGTVNSEVSLDVEGKTSFAVGVGNTSSATNGNIQITSIYVKYKESGSGPFDPLNPNYSIIVPNSALANGTVRLENESNKTINSAKAGELVRLKAEPNTGYALTEGTLVARNSVTGEIISFETGTTNFRMPAANVVIEASFYKLPYHVTYDKNTSDETFDGLVPTDTYDYIDDDNEVTVADGSVLTRQDYLFKEWNTVANPTNENPGVAYMSGDKFEISENTTLYAQWEEKTYTVTLVAPTNGSYVITDAADKPLNDNNYASFEVTNGTVLKYTYTPDPGYKFRNWQVDDGTTHTYSSQASLSYTIDRKSITIEGNFAEIINKKVYFSVNGTIQNPEGLEVEVGTFIPFPDDPAEVEACSFIGWSETTVDSQDAAPTMVNKTSTKMKEADVTYYAVFANAEIGNRFTQITSTTSLEEGAGYLFVGYSSSTYKALPVDKTENLATVTPSSNAISNPAKDLIWTLEKDGNNWKIKSVSNGKYLQISGGNLSFESITNLSWTVSVRNSSFTWTSSASSGNKVLSYYASGNKFNAYTSANTVYMYKAAIVYSGYRTTVLPRTETSLSWSDDAVTAYLNSSTDTFPTLTSSPANLDGIVYTSSNASVATINATTGALSILGKGTTTITASFSGDATYAPAVDASYTLTVSEYTTAVTLERNGATIGDTQVTAKLGFAMPSITKPSKTGHTFQGYYIDSECTGKQYYNASGASANNWDIQEATATLYAKWTATNYTVTFYKNNSSATGSMSNQSIAYGQSANLTANAFTLTGYTFQGWATSATGVVAYADMAEYTMSSASNVTLYAVWNANTYDITLDANGNGSNGSMSIVYNATSATSISHVSTSTEENFKGYYTAAENGNKVVNADGTLVKNVSGWTSSDGKWIKAENATLYAQVGSARKDPVTITYADVTATSYSNTEATFTKNEIEYGYKSIMRNNQNGTPTGWAKEQVIQCQKASTFYNKEGVSMSKIRVYLAANTNTFNVSYGSSTECDSGSVDRPTTATGTESVSYTTYANKKTGNGTTTLNYYDFDLNGASYFKITTGGSTIYIYKIVITY